MSANEHKQFYELVCQGNNTMVSELIGRYCPKTKYCFGHETIFNKCLKGACEHGHLDIAKLLIQHGAHDLNGALSHTCSGKDSHFELANLLIDNGAKDWNRCLLHACANGHFELANLMISKGATNLKVALGIAFGGYNLKLVKLLMVKTKTPYSILLWDKYIVDDLVYAEYILAIDLQNSIKNNACIQFAKEFIFEMFEHGVAIESISISKTMQTMRSIIQEIKLFRNTTSESLTRILIPELIQVVNSYSLT